MNKVELKQLISECVSEVIQESKNINEIDWQNVQRKVGSFAKKGLDKMGLGKTSLGQKASSFAKGKGGYGAKIDKMFNTQGAQKRISQLDKANLGRNLGTLEFQTRTLLNVARATGKENPSNIAKFVKEFGVLLKKYNLEKSRVEPSESV